MRSPLIKKIQAGICNFNKANVITHKGDPQGIIWMPGEELFTSAC